VSSHWAFAGISAQQHICFASCDHTR
jgi:hypothetical protein